MPASQILFLLRSSSRSCMAGFLRGTRVIQRMGISHSVVLPGEQHAPDEARNVHRSRVADSIVRKSQRLEPGHAVGDQCREVCRALCSQRVVREA